MCHIMLIQSYVRWRPVGATKRNKNKQQQQATKTAKTQTR